MNLIKKIKRQLILLGLAAFISNFSYAGEGMWLPLFLKSLNEAEMQSMGMKISAEDIYSVNKGSLKDAIVHFGGFCTSELISSEGLLLTNHHCGYGQIQSHSSLDNNLLKDGFWARNKSEELPNPGLTATFIDQIIDATDKILEGVSDNMSEEERQSMVDQNIDAYSKSFRLAKYQNVVVRPFFHGNQYFAFITTTYSDVRLVGAPPESIGKFGADTDNWVWPRHTGDFSLFRIYAGTDNMPAEYSENNVPYKPKHFLPISLDGVSEGDFTLVFGFPGRTNQYLPSEAVNQLIENQNPARISIRETALDIVDKYMRKDEKTRLQYASKFARIANYWKKWIGERTGLIKTNALKKKQKLEARFLEIGKSQSKKTGFEYETTLNSFNDAYKAISEYAVARDYYQELTSRNIEILRISNWMMSLMDRYENNGQKGYDAYMKRLKPRMKSFYKDYNSSIDMEVFAALTSKYTNELDNKFIPNALSKENFYRRRISHKDMAKDLFKRTMLTNSDRMLSILNAPANVLIAKLKNDPMIQFASDWKETYTNQIAAPYNELKSEIDVLQRKYMKYLMEAFSETEFWPDANSTMRVTYGNVDGYQPRDGVQYYPLTYLDGVIEKYKPGDYEFDVSDKLLELYQKKDYGNYTDRTGKVPVCFLGSNHTTGGNSGSPAIDAYGNLVGLNFDRVWEGTMSDINYDKSICRNIMVDARYILFIIDKYAGADHLIKEMKLVNPKKGK